MRSLTTFRQPEDFHVKILALSEMTRRFRMISVLLLVCAHVTAARAETFPNRQTPATPGAQGDTAPVAPGAVATWAGMHWPAGSENAMYSTGNITTNESEILFGNGTRLPVRVVKDNVPGKWGFSKDTGLASILVVTVPGANPELKEHNHLCGSPVKYLSLWREPRGGLYMVGYLGPDLPADVSQGCAVYLFDNAR